MKEKKQSDLTVLLGYAGSYKGLTFLGLGLSAVAMVLGMLPYICIWLVVRDLIAAAPEWTQAAGISRYGWLAFAFSFAGIAVYFAALMCTHLAAFRTASNIRKAGMAHLMKTPLGYFDSNASGLIRNRLDGAASETETLLAHNLADIVGTAAMFIAMVVLMFVFDWRMGAACLLAAVVSIFAMGTLMGGKNAGLMMEYQGAQDVMSKAGTEYVRGIPVVKVFQQTVYSFKAFKEAIEDYSAKAERFQGEVCRLPQAANLTFTEGAFIFLVPVALFLAPRALQSGNFAEFVTNFAFYDVLVAAKAANCDEFVEKLPQGYATPIGENGARLSGGERQRISIARALLKNAPIVLLDEATASLDVENETKVQGALSRLLAGKTVLVIDHRMRTIEAADKVVVLADGKVTESGNPEELLSKENGMFRRMTGLQAASADWSL